MREIIRAGIDAIDKGQMEAARSLGMTQRLAMRRIVLPQAARVIVPPLGNEFNAMLKNTSLVFTIGVYEMFSDAEIHYSTSVQAGRVLRRGCHLVPRPDDGLDASSRRKSSASSRRASAVTSSRSGSG